jgi:molecular chaperone HscB
LQNHFELFGLAPAFALGPEAAEALERSYRDIQSRVHPDRFAHAGDAERRASLQWTTRVNEAYRTLKDPLQRAKHVLELHGVDVQFETSTQMPGDFLIQQLELREELERAIQAKDAALLDALRRDLAADKLKIESLIADEIDRKQDYPAAAGLVRKLMFLDRLDAEIDAAYETVEA